MGVELWLIGPAPTAVSTLGTPASKTHVATTTKLSIGAHTTSTKATDAVLKSLTASPSAKHTALPSSVLDSLTAK